MTIVNFFNLWYAIFWQGHVKEFNTLEYYRGSGRPGSNVFIT